MKFEILKNVSLKNFSTFRIGGKAKYLFIAKSNKDLLSFLSYCQKNCLKYKIIGLGANLLFDDAGYNGAIIVNKSSKIKFEKNNVIVDGGVSVSNLINKCYLRSLSGFESLSGIPSTVAGAVVNSLGAFDCNFFESIEYVECVKKQNLNKILRLKKDECKFAYRTSIFKNGDYVILSTKLNLDKANKNEIKTKIVDAISKKSSTQPLNLPSAGSVFKRKDDVIPAKIIDDLGLKGLRVGDAQISTKHAGFIVNLGNATSKDVKALIEKVQKEVYSKKNIHFEKEIEFVD